MDDFRFEEEHILFDIAIDKWHKDSIDTTSVIRTFTFPPWYAGNDIRREQMWTFAQKIQTEDIALALHTAKRTTDSRELLRIILAVHNPVFSASHLAVLIEQLYTEFLMEYIAKQGSKKERSKNFDEVFEYYALQLGWQGSAGHFATHLLTDPHEKFSKITYFREYCNRNYDKYICSQQTEDFTTQQMELDIRRMKYLVAYPFVLEDENIDLSEVDIEKTPRKKRTRKPRIRTNQKRTNQQSDTSQPTSSQPKPKPVLATYHPEHLVSPEKKRFLEAKNEETYFSARKFVLLLDRAFAIFQDEELTVGWSRLKAQIEAYGQKVYEDEYDDPEEIYDCAYCDLVTSFDWTYYAYYHQGVSDCEEETPCAIIDALYAFFHTQTRSFPYRIAYFHFLFLVAAEFADGHSTQECIQKTNQILSAHYQSRFFDCAGYRTAMMDDMKVQFAKKEVLSAS
jgi:hypothetical protein